MGTFKKQALGQGQSLIDFAIEKYGCYEGLTLLLMDNPDLVSAVSAILPPGTELKYRDPAPALTETNASVVAAYVANAISVACNCPDLTIEKTFVMGEPVVDYDAMTLTIPFTFTGLSSTGMFKVHLDFAGGGGFDTEYDFNLSDGSLVVPISNYGDGISNGSYVLTFIAQQNDVTSNSQPVEINAPYERAIELVNVTPSAESSVAGDPVDVELEFNLLPGWDGTNPVDWVGDETFVLQYFDGTNWVTVGDSFTQAAPTMDNVQLPNGTYDFRIKCAENDITSQDINTSISFGHDSASLSFNLNVPSSDSAEPIGMVYKVTVDGEEFIVEGDATKTGVAMHNEMKTLLLANTQGFTLPTWVENGSPTNYAYGIKAPSGSNGTWNGKVVRVEVIDPNNVGYGNITINGEYSTGAGGTDPLEGEFSGGY